MCAEHHECCSCLADVRISRRGLLAAAAGSVAALQMSLLEFTSALADELLVPQSRPKVRVVFIRPKEQSKYWMSWPGNDYDADAHQAEFIKLLREIANQQGIQLEVDRAPLENDQAVDAALARVKKSAPDGILVIQMHLSYWKVTDRFLENRGNIPTIVFSRLGTSFTGHLQVGRRLPNVYIAATDGLDWLHYGMRMFKTMGDMKNSRICIVTGAKTVDRRLDGLGTTLHYIPLQRWVDEFNSAKTTAAMRQVAQYYTQHAKAIKEPKPIDILNAAKNYFVARSIMAAEKCDGISLNCLQLVRNRQIPCPPCIAWSKLNDEGSVGACEADWNAAISMRLISRLFGRPGFQQDPAPNTVRNTLMGAHCTCATKLNGFDAKPEPFILRSHHESSTGVSPQVLWRIGQEVTIVDFQGPKSILVGTGRVLRNFETPTEGGCRTSVELAIDKVANCADIKGFHQLFIYGKLDNKLKAYCKLAGIAVLPLA